MEGGQKMTIYDVVDSDFWRMNNKEFSTHTIEWTPKAEGWCRARLDDLSPWVYRSCACARFAEGIGEGLIEVQKRQREMRDDYAIEGYHGA